MREIIQKNEVYVPLPHYGSEIPRYGSWDDAFTKEQIQYILKYCSSLSLSEAILQKKETDLTIRKNNIAWLPYNKDTIMIYSIISDVIARINDEVFKYDLSGMHELIQYSEYHKTEHYKAWHTDNASKDHQGYKVPRKLSLTMQLSNSEEYEGGLLQLKFAEEEITLKKEIGIIHLWPAYTLHRVTPITKGIRKSLVIWVGGPSFR